MTKLQKTRQQRREPSGQPAGVPRNKQEIQKVSSIASNQKHRALSCPPQMRQRIPKATGVFPINGKSSLINTKQGTFLRLPSAPEAAFVAVGREQFLHRANMLAQAYARKFGSDGSTKLKTTEEPTSVASVGNSQEKTHPSSPLCKRSSHASFNVRHESEIDSNLINSPKADVTRYDEMVPSSSEPEFAPVGKSREVVRKRSQSLPAIFDNVTAPTKTSRLSFSPLQAIQSFRNRQQSRSAHQPPFTPKVNLEMVFDAVPTGQTESTLASRRKSDMLPKTTVEHQRSMKPEVGVLRKRRRVSSPADLIQPLAIPYASTKSGVEPNPVYSLKGELPSSKLRDFDARGSVSLSSPSDANISDVSKGSSSTSLIASDFSSQYGSAKSNIEKLPMAYTACPHCGHQQQDDSKSDSSHQGFGVASTSNISLDEPKSTTNVHGTSSGPSALGKRSNSIPGTPVEVSIDERMQTAKAIILAASKEENCAILQPCSSSTCSNSASNQMPNNATKNASALEGIFKDISNANPYDTNPPLDHNVPSSPLHNSGNLRASCHIDNINDTKYEQLQGFDIDKNVRDRLWSRRASRNKVNPIVVPSNIKVEPLPRQREIEEMYFAASDISSVYTQARSRSPSVSVGANSGSLNNIPQARTSEQYTRSNENFEISSKTSKSPAHGILIVSSTIISKRPITEIHPALRGQSTEAFENTTGKTSMQNALSVTKPLKESTISSSTRSTIRQELPALIQRRRTSSQSLHASNTTLMKREAESNFEKAEDETVQRSPRLGTQSLLQFQRNCRPVPDLVPSESSVDVSMKRLSPSVTDAKSEKYVNPPLRRKPQLQEANLSRNKLQKLDPNHSNDDRGRRRGRPSKPSITKRSSSKKAVVTSIAEIAAMPTIPKSDPKQSTKHKEQTSPIIVPSHISSPKLPPNSYNNSKGDTHGETRSGSRGRSRIRSMLESVRIVSRDGRKQDDDQDKRTSHYDSDGTSTDFDLFKSGGPYESITNPIAASSSRSIRRRGRMKEKDMRG